MGAGLYIPHFGTIVVNPTVTLGENVYLSHNITLGKVHSGKRQGAPKIGNDVFIGAGAVVIGNVHIGNNAFLCPNCVVIDDVPDNAVVSGQPAKIISMKGASAALEGTPSLKGHSLMPKG